MAKLKFGILFLLSLLTNYNIAFADTNTDYVIKSVDYDAFIGKTQNELFALFGLPPSDKLYVSSSVEYKDGKVIAVAKVYDIPFQYECEKPSKGYIAKVGVSDLPEITYENGKIISVKPYDFGDPDKRPLATKISYSCFYLKKQNISDNFNPKNYDPNYDSVPEIVGMYGIIIATLPFVTSYRLVEPAQKNHMNDNYYNNFYKISDIALGQEPAGGFAIWKNNNQKNIKSDKNIDGSDAINFSPDPKLKYGDIDLYFKNNQLIKIENYSRGGCYLYNMRYFCEDITKKNQQND